MIKIVSFINIIVIGIFFNACSPEKNTTQKNITGIFEDSFVASLHYKCSSSTDDSTLITNELGEFTCNDDDNISFSIGTNFYIGQTKVSELITPLSLYPHDASKVLNLIQLLQTLDSDNNSENGIQLDESLLSHLQDTNISLSDVDFDTNIEILLGKELISSEKAFEHFSQTLKKLNLEDFKVDYTTPLFTSNTTIDIYENLSKEIQITATDNASLTYSINKEKTVDASNFTIESQSGILRFTFTPDYELQTIYKVTIDVTDGLNRASQEFTINILDSDENPPLINTKSEIIVQENQLTVTTIDAEDENTLSYFLSGEDSDFFTLDASTGVLTFKKLADYEEQSSYKVTLSVSDGINITNKDITIFLLDIQEQDIPLLAIVMNWSDYYESSALLWHNKLFYQENSVASWYAKNTEGEVQIFPVEESSGTKNDGIIMIDMQKPHPGSIDTTLFRDTYIKDAITNSEVLNSIDFSKYDKDKNNILDKTELQLLFIVAGGEESYGDNSNHSIWALSWSFENYNAPSVDGIEVMKYTGDATKSGSFLMFGANHGNHSATVGIIAHELGHSLLNLYDYYDDGGGSGLGLYDIMSGGSWGFKTSDTYDGETPTQFSVFNKIEANLIKNITTVDATQTLTLKCSANEGIKLKTQNPHEYFLIECRDTENRDSDASFISVDSSFSNKLFTAIYHVDDAKDFEDYFVHSNTEDGTQTDSHHYNVALVEKDSSKLMTDTEGIIADFADVYREGDTISSSKFKLYDGTSTGFNVEIVEEDYSSRSVKIKIIK